MRGMKQMRAPERGDDRQCEALGKTLDRGRGGCRPSASAE